MMPLRIVIRADASVARGTGHVMRCVALAQALRSKGHQVIFLQAESTPALTMRLAAEGLRVEFRPVEPGSPEDARWTTELARREKADWVVGDSYAFADDWQQGIKAAGLGLLVLDDYGHATRYHADFILNQNLSARAGLYPQRASSTKLLLGPRYTLLRADFLQHRGNAIVRRTGTQRVLVTLGGSDPDDITSRVLAGLKALPEAEVVVVVGGSNPHREQLVKACAGHPKWRLVVNTSEMAELMVWADVAVSAAGSTSWEIALLGLPGVTLVTAPNQVDIGPALERAGVAICLGEGRDLQPAALAAAVSRLLSDPVRRAQMGLRAAALIDGLGAGRVVTQLQAKQLAMRRATLADSRAIWELANDPDVRAASFSSTPIPWGTHQQWLLGKISSQRDALYLGEGPDHELIGQVRFSWDAGGTAEIGVSVAKSSRNAGWGSALICRAMDEIVAHAPIRTVVAYIKSDNRASVGAFEKAGFKRDGQLIKQGVEAIRLIYVTNGG